MLTARAEYRLRLRANNAGSRLTPLALTAGCVGAERREWFARRENTRAQIDAALEAEVSANDLAQTGLAVRADGARRTLGDWLRFPEVSLSGLAPWLGQRAIDPLLAEEIEEDAAYAPYLARQESELRDLRANQSVVLGDRFAFTDVPGLSREMVERLSAARPETLAAASRVAGITPAALASLLVHARRQAA
jgi:tRNA uridine 5-carboxymethylaminomethyl modification enzyme